MAISTSFGYTDTVSTTLNVARPDLSYSSDYAEKTLSEAEKKAASKQSDREVRLTNSTSPVDQPETVRIASRVVKDIYSNAGISAPYQTQNKQGVSLCLGLQDILRVTDDTDSSFQIDIPINAHLVLTAPMTHYVTTSHLMTVLCRLMALTFDTGKTTTSRLDSLIRGSLLPKGVA